MVKVITKYFLLSLLAIISWSRGYIHAQNLENIGKGEAISVSGGVNASGIFYQASGIEDRRNPFNYFLSGNLNFNLYGWSIPLSFSYSDQNSQFQQPFNQYGLSPNYKWLTLHAGYRSMTFSNYTVNGHLFLGGGFDAIPNDRLKISAFYGRLQKAVEEDTTNFNNTPMYKRMGGGVKVTLGDQTNFVDLIIFKAKDDPTSLSQMPTSTMIAPEENLVLGFNFGTKLFDKLILTGEVASSALTRDLNTENVSVDNFYNSLKFAFQSKVSSSYYQAYKGALQYAFGNMALGVAYERVEPGYRTLGSYYFNNNLESVAITHSMALMNKKIRVNSRVGVQRNNLDKKQLNSMNRLSGAVNVNYQASPKLMINASYTNFQTVINFRSQFDDINRVSPYENLDTLNFRQVSQNATTNINYTLGDNKEKRQNINLNLAYQQTADEQATLEQPTGSQFYNLNTAYSVSFSELDLTINVAGNANFITTSQSESKIFGPSLSTRKSFLEKTLAATLSVSYNNAYTDNKLTGKVINLRASGNYTLKEKHQFNLNLTRIDRISPQNSAQPKFNEFTVQIGYNFNF